MCFPPSRSDRRVVHVLLLVVAVGVTVGMRLPSFFPDATHSPAATFLGSDGRQHVYLGGYDAYYWLQLARTLLATGTPCDRFEDGTCIDAYGNAPAGEPIASRHSPQIGAVAAAHVVLSRVDPGIPLSTSAMIVPVVIAAAGAIAAYAIGVLASGPAGGILAALLVSCNPVVLGRTIEGDDDIWVVVLPLLVCCASALALRPARRCASLLWSAVAGGLLALTAAAWEGWPFFAAVAADGIVLAGIVRRDRRALVVLGVLCAACLSCGAGFGVRLHAPGMAAEALRFAHIASPPSRIETAPLPNSFAAVAELQAVDASALIRVFGVPALALGIAGFATLFIIGRGAAVRKLDPVWYLLIAWLALSLVIAFDALRYVVLAAVPLAAITGAGAGAIVRALLTTAPTVIWQRAARAIVAALVAALTVAPALAQGATLVRVQSPEINAAWVDTLHDIREQEPASAIVDVWWDRGHWAKYFSHRAVSNDGATLGLSTNYWLALALAAPSDEESVRYLRMLDCGNVVDPATGASARPFETLTAWLGDGAAAYRTLTALMQSPRSRHRTVLADAGLGTSRTAALLRTVDCTPPPAVLLLSTALLSDKSWYLNAEWDPYRAYLVDAAHGDPARVAEDAAKRYGRPLDTTRALIADAAAARGEAQRDAFAAPQARMLGASWSPCAMNANLLRCSTPVGIVYADPAVPEHIALLAGSRQVPLSFAEIAGPSGMSTVVPTNTDARGPAAIVDLANLRVFVGMPAVVRSTLVRLVLLGGRYDPAFALGTQHVAQNGEAVSSWRVRWAPSPAASAGAAR